MPSVVLIRHGQSEWNRANRFTGWVDVDLTDQGRAEAAAGADRLAEAGFTFDVAYTSVLKRAIRTLWIVLERLDHMWIPVTRAWQLNERHYGALQGLNKQETAEKHGDEQVLIWRRSYATPPPRLETTDPMFPGNDRRYAGLSDAELPRAEALLHTVNRVVPYWEQVIVPEIRAGKRVLIAAHGNSMRALVKHLDGMSEEDVLGLNIPTGVPMVYDLDDDLNATGRRYLGDPAEIEAATHAVAQQGVSRE